MDIGTNLKDNLQAIIISMLSNGENKVEELDTNKIIAFIKEKYGIDVSEDTLQNLLSSIPNVDEIIKDKIIIKSDPSEPIETNEIDDDVKDMAIKGAKKNLADAYNAILKIKIGGCYPAKSFKLLKEDEDYYLHVGAVKTNSKYIIKKITENTITAKLPNNLTINFPITRVC